MKRGYSDRAAPHRTVYRSGPRQLRFEERDSVEQLAINGDGKMPSNFELGFAPDQGRVYLRALSC